MMVFVYVRGKENQDLADPNWSARVQGPQWLRRRVGPRQSAESRQSIGGRSEGGEGTWEEH